MLRLACFSAAALTILSAFAAEAETPDQPSPPDQARVAMQMAENMRGSGNPQGAIVIYQRLAAKPDGNTDAHIALASLYRKSGQAKDAVAVMRVAQARKPDDETVLAALGHALIDAEEYEEAVNVFDMLTAVNHDSIVGYNGKAVAFDKAGNHVAAQEIYQQALRLDPASVNTQNNLAMSFILSNQPDHAIALLEPLSTQSDVPKAVHHNLALAYGIKGDKKRARDINMTYMDPEQAVQNQAFYERYARMLKKQKKDAQTAVDAPPPEPVELAPAAAAPAKAVGTVVADEPADEQPPAPESGSTFFGLEAKPDYPGR